MRVLVCGGRHYANRTKVYEVLDALHGSSVTGNISLIVTGCAPGADTLAQDWATIRKVDLEGYPANWKQDGKAAGPIRNRRMLEKGKPDLVVAFPGDRGTANMALLAKNAGVPVRFVT